MKGKRWPKANTAQSVSSSRSKRRPAHRLRSSAKRSSISATRAKILRQLRSRSSTGRVGPDTHQLIKRPIFANFGELFAQLTFAKIGKVKHATDLRCAYLDFDRIGIPLLRPIFSVCHIAGVRPLWIESRRTKRGWHLRIMFHDRFEPAELVAFQAACGSDPRREALNLMRVLCIRKHGAPAFWRKRWNLLYSEKL